MKKDTMLDCFLTIKEIRSKVANMVLFNEKAHKHFFALVKIVENELINVEDNYDHDSDADLKVVSDITKLKFEVDQYMKTGRLNDDPELFFSEQDYLSGSELEKQHRMGIYKNLALVLQEMEEIDIEKLKKIRERWLIEKDNYSEIEKEKVEEVLAEAFLVYQTKFIISEKNFLKQKFKNFVIYKHMNKCLKVNLQMRLQNCQRIHLKD